MRTNSRRTLVAVVATVLGGWQTNAVEAQTFTPKGKSVAKAVAPAADSAPPRTGMRRSAPSSLGVDYISSARMDSALQNVATVQGRGATFNGSKDGRAQYVLNRRTDPSVIEVHCQWDDILVIRSGEGLLRHGTNVLEPMRFWSYEWRAQRIEKAVEVGLHPGDVVRVPAGLAHEVRSAGLAPLVYLIVKMSNFAHEGCREFPFEGR